MNDQQQSRADALTDEHIATLKLAARAVTPQDIDGAERIESRPDGSYITCPACEGEGCIPFESDYCNYDHVAIGVQFYGVGTEPGAAEAYFRAAKPATILALLDRLERAESALAAPPVEQPAAAPADERAALPQIPDLVKATAWLTMCLRTELSRLDDDTHKALDEVEAQLSCVRAITNGAIDYEAMVAARAAASPAAEAVRLTDEQRRVLVEVAQMFKGTDRRRAVLNELAGIAAAPQPAHAEAASPAAEGETEDHECVYENGDGVCRQCAELAKHHRAAASPAAERVTAALQALSADVHTLGDGWANDEAMIGLAKKYLRVEPKPASPELSLWRDFVLLAVTDAAPQPAQADAPAHAAECPHCDGEGVIEGDSGTSPCACQRDAQEGMPTFGARRAQADAPAEAREPNQIYVEVRQCDRCDHIGINDGHATDAACGYPCGWSGPSPVEDKCPGCGHENVMSVACPKCSGHYSLLANGLFETNEVSEPAEAREPIAWVTDDDRAITAAQKQRALADGGATASSVRPYSIPCYAISAPADAGEAREPIGPHDLSTTAGGRSYVAEFFAKRLRRHDFGRYITGQLAADFACSLAAYLRDHDHAAADAGEAVGIVHRPARNGAGFSVEWLRSPPGGAKLYTAPPAARVASLTDEQHESIEHAATWLGRSEDLQNKAHAKRLCALLNGDDQ